MKHLKSIMMTTVLALAFASPTDVRADRVDGAPANELVQFGVPGQLGDANHFLGRLVNGVFVRADEFTINKGGTVTFMINGGGHGISIYPVSKGTVRKDIEEDLCENMDECDVATFSSEVTDAKGDVIIDTDPSFLPANRISYPDNRLVWIGGGAFLANGTQVDYRFEKTGRFLVNCINREHFIMDHMFAFINVVGGDLD